MSLASLLHKKCGRKGGDKFLEEEEEERPTVHYTLPSFSFFLLSFLAASPPKREASFGRRKKKAPSFSSLSLFLCNVTAVKLSKRKEEEKIWW